MAIVFFIILGAIMGSFANALLFRFGNDRPIVRDQRSYCDHCGNVLSWFELIPVVSYVIQLGRCRSCRGRIPVWTLVVEILMALGFAFGARTVGNMGFSSGVLQVAQYIVVLSFVFGCVFFFFIDWLYMIIPDHVSLPLIVLGCIGIGVLHRSDWISYVLAGILGGSFFLVQYLCSRGRWVGGGDIRLGVFLGVYLGLSGLGVALVVAYGIGLVCALVLLWLKRASLKTAVPFGVMLMAGGVIAHWFGDAIIHWYVYTAPLLLLNVVG